MCRPDRLLHGDARLEGEKVLFQERLYGAVVHGHAGVMSIQAGNDLVVTTDYRTQIPRVIQAVKDGALEEEAVDPGKCFKTLPRLL